VYPSRTEKTLCELAERLLNAGKARNYMLHGVWREYPESTWGLHPQPIEVTGFRREKKAHLPYNIQTNDVETEELCIRVDVLRRDLRGLSR
jgi:hypothetical protein